MSYGPHTRNPWESTGDPFAAPQEHAKSHKGGQVSGCDCADCLDTRERLQVAMDAMALHGEAADICRCDGCQHWMIDGAPENGRIDGLYLCPTCYGRKLAQANALPMDFHDTVRSR